MEGTVTIIGVLVAGNVAQATAIIWLAKQNNEANKKAIEAALDSSKKVLEANTKTVAATLKATERKLKMLDMLFTKHLNKNGGG